MKLSSDLPVSHMSFAHWHTDDTEVGVALAKATFELTTDGQTRPQAEPPELEMADVFQEDPADSALITEQDIAPFKPKTDLIIRGEARSFGKEPLTDWPVTIEIADILNHSFLVRGPSTWLKPMLRWQLSKPDAVTSVPLTYALAYGGKCEEEEGPVFYEQNPSGLGFMTDEALREVKSFAAPQIGLLAEFMAATPTGQMMVEGTMPIAKTWLPRRSHAGTFDEAWEKKRHPRMPRDYDLAFWNAAHPRLQISPYLQGDEKIKLTGMSHTHEVLSLRLPGAKLALRSTTTPEAEVLPMNLDTVDLDVSGVDDGQVKITLLWRAMVPHREDYFNAEIIRG